MGVVSLTLICNVLELNDDVEVENVGTFPVSDTLGRKTILAL